MPSPFPGMNPFLEHRAVWHDFHDAFLPALRALMTPQLPDRYVVMLDEHLYVHELPDQEGRLLGRSDISLARPAANPPGETMALVDAPAQVQVPLVDMVGENFLEIRDRDSREVVTTIELLSPTNKTPGPDREQYLAKRGQVLRSRSHLVEIDLLRGGLRMPMTGLPPCDYCILISRWERRPDAETWPFTLRDPLPTLRVPLQAPDADLLVDLNKALQRVFDEAGYASHIYGRQPQPPLAPNDADWAKNLLAQATP